MRFAWLRENSANNVSIKPGFTNRFIYIGYNVVYWVPILPPLLGIIDYRTGFIVLTVILIARLAANLYRNNVLTPEQAEVFPLRSP
jgi:hypothetical protein